ncbi:hypothetical protein ACWEQU_08170 [Streptomyces nodosus]
MTGPMPPRLRAPLVIIGAGLATGLADVAVRGWATTPVVILVATVGLAAIGYWFVGGRDTDRAALIRREPDERQAQQRLQVQALVGKAMTLAAAVAFATAVALDATLWPFAIALALPVLTAAVGWARYGDRQR